MKFFTLLICIPCLLLILFNSAQTQEPHYEEIEIDEGPVPLNKAIQLIDENQDGSLSLNKNAIKSVMKNTKLGKRKAVIISVVGAYRRGKSFLLNFMIRFLRAQGRSDWIGPTNTELDGFSWSSGKTRNTNGILLWPEIFPVGEDMAVMLLDTQGSFDSEATFKENSFIFALSTLMSSISVYNLHERIQMDDLDNLQFFMELGRLAQDDSQNKPFQNLLFLIRDWKFNNESPYGFDGGKTELFDWLKKHAEQRGTSDTLASYFSQVACYLMPYPGDLVSRSNTFRGKISEIDKDFMKHLDVLLKSILSGPGLIAKQFSGQNVQVQNFPDVMEQFLISLQSDKVPQPRSLLESTAALSNILLARDAKDSYKLAMDAIFASRKSVEDLEGENVKAKTAALEYFDTTRKFGGPDLAVPYRLQLIKELDTRYEIYKSRNEKRIQFEREAQMKMQILNRFKDMFEWTISNIACINMENIYKFIENFDWNKVLESLDLSKLIQMIDLKTSGVFYIGAILLVIARVAATLYNRINKGTDREQTPIIEDPE